MADPKTISASFALSHESSSVMLALWETAAPRPSGAELEWFTGASELAQTAALNLRDVMEGVDCLISQDVEGSKSSRAAVGSPQGDGALTVLASFAASLDAIAGMIAVGNAATARLIHPDRYVREQAKELRHA